MLLLFLLLHFPLKGESDPWSKAGKYTLTFSSVQTYQSDEFVLITGSTVYNGTLYAVDRDAHRVHMINPENGAYLGSFGRKGEGPGEFQFMGYPSFGKVGDAFFIIDGDLISRFSMDGNYLSREQLPSRFGVIRRSKPLTNGTYLFVISNHLEKEGKNRDKIIIWDPKTDQEKILAEKSGNRYHWEGDCWLLEALADEFTFFTVDDARTIVYSSFHDQQLYLADLTGHVTGKIKIPWSSYPIQDEERGELAAFRNATLKKADYCRKFVARGEPVFMALIPFDDNFLVGKFRSYDGLFDVRVLNRKGEVLGSGRHLFGEHGKFSQGDDGYFYAVGVQENGDWRIERLKVQLVPN